MSRIGRVLFIACLLGLAGLAHAAHRLAALQSPLFFEANQGQVDPAARFVARGDGVTLFLTLHEAIVALRGAAAPAVVRMRWLGANPAPEIAGRDELAGKVNYLIGADPTRWRRHVPTYARVVYRGVYPGIDLVFHGRDRRLEYDFVVAPGADPAAVRVAFEGAESVALEHGDLVLGTPAGPLRMPRPVLYQEMDGTRREVAGGYRLDGPHVGFAVGAYDRTRPLVIDPALVYSTYLGGTGVDEGPATAVDGAGNVYVAGRASPGFPVAPGVLQPTFGGGLGDAFVAKLTPDGSGVVYATYLGGSGSDRALAIAVDGAGDAYLAGETDAVATDFPTVNAIQSGPGPCSPGGPCLQTFVAKLNSTGSALVYSTYFGGNGVGRGIAVDGTGHAYVTGSISGASPLVTTHFHPTARGGAFVLKLDPDGSLVYAADFGAGAGHAIAVNARGSAYVAGGGAFAPPFPTTPGALQTTASPGSHPHAFVAKLDPAGSSLIYSTILGGSGEESANGIAIDREGNAYVTGGTRSSDFPILNGLQPAFGGVEDAFVTKLNPIGSGLVYSTYLGGRFAEIGFGIAVDGAGFAYVAGATVSPDFPVVDPIQPRHVTAYPIDAFVAKLAPDGAALVYSTPLGGTETDSGLGIALDAGRNAHVVGITQSSDFPTANALQPASGGTTDAFVAKIGETTAAGCTGGFAIGPSAATPDPVAPGGTETIQVQVCSGSAASDILVDVELYGASAQRVGQNVTSGQSFAAGEAKTYTWEYPVPATLPEGEYTVKVGLFSRDWSTLHHWENHAATFQVGGGSPPPPGACPGGFTVGPTTAGPDPVARGGTETIQVQVCSGSAASDILVDVELYGASAQRVGQNVTAGQSFAAGEAKTYTWEYPVPATLPEGEYTVKVGLFSRDWSTLHHWENHAATFQVGDRSPPPPGACPGGFTVGPTTAAPDPVARGATVSIETGVCSGAAASDIVVDLELYDAGGARVAQTVFGGHSFAAGEARIFTWAYPVPTTLPAGEYTVKVGLFSGDWSILHHWENHAATFHVGGGSSPPPGACSGGFTVGPTTAAPDPVARGATVSIETRVCSGAAAADVLVDLELYDASGARVAQTVIGGQSFAAGEAKTYSWAYPVPATLGPGPYTVKVGLFSRDWSTLHLWENHAATFAVQ
jgi:hypothetical protein